MLHQGGIRLTFKVELASCCNLRSLEGKLPVCCRPLGFRTLACHKSSHVGLFLGLCGLLASTGLTDGPSRSLSVTGLHLLIYSVSERALLVSESNKSESALSVLVLARKIESHPAK